MSDVVIKVENVGKQYHLGKVGTGTMANDLNRWWHIARGKEDPFLKIGTVNDRTSKSIANDIVWAVKNINFEVKRGEVLGIIGKNGAGKSTLLKILSRVTAPTIGDIKVKGRIASLLEVGTGFHPDLSGRENIFLNGAILGMTKAEIKSKFDEIVDFSGVERYIDTPVKRYSSGMYVRLAFAVAAHLEPEILIVDEVLAVGDAEFQKKCLGKMKDVSEQGRTVLFVSHNMSSLQELCDTSLVLKNGELVMQGTANEGINFYRSSLIKINSTYQKDCAEFLKSKISKIEILNSNKRPTDSIRFGENFKIQVTLSVKGVIRNPIVSARISNANNINIVTFRSNDYQTSPLDRFLDKDNTQICLTIENLYLLNDNYQISIGFADGKEILEVLGDVVSFEVLPQQLRPDLKYITKQQSSNSILFHDAAWEIIS